MMSLMPESLYTVSNVLSLLPLGDLLGAQVNSVSRALASATMKKKDWIFELFGLPHPGAETCR